MKEKNKKKKTTKEVRRLAGEDLILVEGDLLTGIGDVEDAVGRMYFARCQARLVVHAADKQRLALLGLSGWDSVRRDLAALHRHPNWIAAAKYLQKRLFS